jgi:hypothetical protein
MNENAYFADTSGLLVSGRFNSNVFEMMSGESKRCAVKLFETTALHFVPYDSDL